MKSKFLITAHISLFLAAFIISGCAAMIGKVHGVKYTYQSAETAYEELFKKTPESFWRDEAVYNQAVCYDAISEYAKAYKLFKIYMSFDKNVDLYR